MTGLCLRGMLDAARAGGGGRGAMNFVIRKGVREAVSAQIARQIADAIARGEYKPGASGDTDRKNSAADRATGDD